MPTQTCVHGSCKCIAYRTDGLCKKHAKALGKSLPKRPVEEAQTILADLRTHGWSLNAIEEAAGITAKALKYIAAGKERNVRHGTIATLASLKDKEVDTGDRFPAWPTTRRLRALQAAGHSGEILAELTGMCRSNISKLSLGRALTVSKATRDSVDHIWQKLANQPVIGPPTRTAARMGWKPPLGWNNIDDPEELSSTAFIPLSKHERTLAQRVRNQHKNHVWDEEIGWETLRRIAAGEVDRVKVSTLDFIYLRSELDRNITRKTKEHANAA